MSNMHVQEPVRRLGGAQGMLTILINTVIRDCVQSQLQVVAEYNREN